MTITSWMPPSGLSAFSVFIHIIFITKPRGQLFYQPHFHQRTLRYKEVKSLPGVTQLVNGSAGI